MTIRSGGRPRDAVPRRPARTTPTPTRPRAIPEYSEPVRRGRRRPRRRPRRQRAASGLLKFLVFALVLAAIVLAVALTALRPVVGGAVVGLAEDNPAALQLPFVARHRPRGPRRRADRRRPRPTRPRSSSSSRTGDTAATIADAARGRGPAHGQPGVRLHRHRPRADRRASSRAPSSCARTMTPDQLVSALLAPPDGHVRRHRAADRACASSRSRPSSRRSPARRWTRRSSTSSSSTRRRRSSPTTRGSRRSSRTPRRAPRSRASCGRRPTACCPTRRPRSSSG